MTTEFGSDTRLDETGATVRIASRLLNGWLSLLPRSGDVWFGFDRQKLRLSLHGESEHTGDAYNRGQVVALLAVSNALIGILPLTLLGILGEPGSVPPVLLLPVPIFGLFALCNVSGSVDLIDELQVFDHTTPKTDTGELDAVKRQFTNGEIGEDEFDRRVDELIKAETEARLE